MSLLPAEFHFLAPQWLWALAGLPVALLLVWWQGRKQHQFDRLVDAELLPHLLEGKTKGQPHQLLWLSLVWLLTSLALAGPSWQRYPTPALSHASARVIAVSLAKTMYADDVSPSRISRARFKVRDLLRANADGQNALIGFAGQAFVVAPLTRDSHSLSALLRAMNPSIMPVSGHNAAAAIKRGVDLLEGADMAQGQILLITDEANEAAIEAAAQAEDKGFSVSVLGVGGDDKVPVQLPGGELLHNQAGQLALTQRDTDLLQQIAAAGGGLYVSMSADGSDIAALQKSLDSGHAQQQQRQLQRWRNAGPWLLLPLLLLLALAYRRGALLLLALLPLAWSHPAQAFGWQDLWQRPDQQAAAALAQQQPERAEAVAESPEWKGVAAYQAGHYQQAIDSLRAAQGADASYNLGNALAQAGKLKAAISAYEKAIEQQPDNADARHNLALVKKLLQQKKQQQKQQQKKQKQKQGKQQPGTGHSRARQQKQSGKQGKSGKQSPSGKQGESSQQQQPSDSQQGKQQSRQQQKPSASQENDQPQGAGQPKSPQQRQADKQQRAKASQQFQQQMSQSLKAAKQGKGKKEKQPVYRLGQQPQTSPMKELPASTQRLLQSVPDKPGALLRRKFQLQYRQRQAQGDH